MTPTIQDYARIFEAERQVEYPVIDAFEQRMGYAIDRSALEDAARVLACPFKAHAPNWQHGRVLYASARRQFAQADGPVNILDVGTAKGFSALCLQWALRDSPASLGVVSVDVLSPDGRVKRNTVAECDGYKTLAETLEPWPAAQAIAFFQRTGIAAIQSFDRIHLCYLDGKHTYDTVAAEIIALATRQQPGDVVMFDDAQIEGVEQAIETIARPKYEVEYLDVLSHRRYAIGTRRG